MTPDPPHTLKLVTAWLLLGLVVFLGIQWWQHEQQRSRFSTAEGVVEIRRAADGHYHWPGAINGRRVDFLVDTGASGTAIPMALARELNLDLEREVMSSTAGGIVRGRETRADVELDGGVRAERLRLTALPALDYPLLGMNVLGRLRWQQRDGVLIVELGETR